VPCPETGGLSCFGMMSLGFGDFIAGITAETLMPNTVYDVHILDCTVSYLEEEGVLK